MRTAPTLGQLALRARIMDPRQLDEGLTYQRHNYLAGDFRRLGELMVDFTSCSREQVCGLLRQQGITIAVCELCGSRYNALGFQGHGACLRCGRSLQVAPDDGPLTVEDALSGGGAQADHLLQEYRQRNPRIGRYEILGELGRGAMGVIYKAWETNLQRNVALKFLRPYEDLTDEDRERFRREARAVAALSHENIVHAYAIEEVNGLSYMAMDFVEGVSMDLLAEQKTLQPKQVVQIAAQVARALQCAHDQGILHRDVKPANVVIDRRGKPFLVDFGIAKVMGADAVSLTTEGEVLGSLAYMAPEYVTQGATMLDRRCDVYGLGVVLYEAISGGKLPYGDPDDEMMIMRVVKGEPRSFADACPSAPEGLAAIIDRAISRDRAVRHDSAAELADELETYLRGGHVERRKAAPRISGSAAALSAMETAKTAVPQEAAPEAPAQRGGGALAWGLVALFGLAALGLGSGWALSQQKARAQLQAWQLETGEAQLRAAEALERVGDREAALEAYGRAVELMPRRPDVLEGRARARASLGDAEGAAADRAAAAELRRAGVGGR